MARALFRAWQLAVTKKGVFEMKSNPNRQSVAAEFTLTDCRHGRSQTGTGRRTVQHVIPPPAAGGNSQDSRRRGLRMSRRTLALADLKLRQIEDAFLDSLLDAHPRRVTALERLLDDLASVEPARADVVATAAVPAPDADVAAASARRIEASLLAAVIEHHPRRDRALDRLLNDVEVAGNATAPSAAHGAWVDDDESRARPDTFCDCDFDGLG
jgi:hypothetical protein